MESLSMIFHTDKAFVRYSLYVNVFNDANQLQIFIN